MPSRIYQRSLAMSTNRSTHVQELYIFNNQLLEANKGGLCLRARLVNFSKVSGRSLLQIGCWTRGIFWPVRMFSVLFCWVNVNGLHQRPTDCSCLVGTKTPVRGGRTREAFSPLLFLCAGGFSLRWQMPAQSHCAHTNIKPSRLVQDHLPPIPSLFHTKHPIGKTHNFYTTPSWLPSAGITVSLKCFLPEILQAFLITYSLREAYFSVQLLIVCSFQWPVQEAKM